jgi:ribonuclease HII
MEFTKSMILGIDEVGRGPWAGPLVVGAVVLNDAMIEGLTDSKKLSKKQRESLSQQIMNSTADIGLGWVYPDELDEIGLSNSLIEATKRAVSQITSPYHEIIIDGTINFLKNTNKGQYVTTLKKADLLISSVSAASIVAKVARDRYMTEQDLLYPGYGFAAHVGYGTALHRAAIEKNGITPLHRLSFAPLAKYRKAAIVNTPSLNEAVTTKQIGDHAEEIVAKHLKKHGHNILERNWKTKVCEIDIVSHEGDTIYFTEVKYRKNAVAGGGVAAVTSKKLKQMKFAAELYGASHTIGSSNLRLAIADVAGTEYILNDWFEIT